MTIHTCLSAHTSAGHARPSQRMHKRRNDGDLRNNDSFEGIWSIIGKAATTPTSTPHTEHTPTEIMCYPSQTPPARAISQQQQLSTTTSISINNISWPAPSQRIFLNHFHAKRSISCPALSRQLTDTPHALRLRVRPQQTGLENRTFIADAHNCTLVNQPRPRRRTATIV